MNNRKLELSRAPSLAVSEVLRGTRDAHRRLRNIVSHVMRRSPRVALVHRCIAGNDHILAVDADTVQSSSGWVATLARPMPEAAWASACAMVRDELRGGE